MTVVPPVVQDGKNEWAVFAMLALLHHRQNRRAPDWYPFWLAFPAALRVLGDSVSFGCESGERERNFSSALNNAYHLGYCRLPKITPGGPLMINLSAAQRKDLLRSIPPGELRRFVRATRAWWAEYLEQKRAIRGA